jgi:glycosyltransferase involved in cell wall biosynthesis
VGGIPDQAGGFGVLFEGGAEELAAAMRDVFQRYADFEAAAGKMAAYARARFTIPAMIAQHERLYASLVGRPARRGALRFAPVNQVVRTAVRLKGCEKSSKCFLQSSGTRELNMTIIHIGPHLLPILYSLGGATERRIRELAARQAAAGSKVIVYSAEDRTSTYQHQGFEVRAIECRRQGTLRAAEFLYKSIRDARRLRPDIMHFHSQAEGAAFTKLFAWNLKTRPVLSFDFFEFRRGKKNPFFRWYKRALTSFAALLPVSRYCLTQAAEYWSMPQGKMRVVYNGVSLQQFHPDAAAAANRRTALGLGSDFTIVYVGRVCHQKGSDLLIDAYAKLRAEGRPIRLVIAGPIGQFGQKGANEFTQRLEEHQGIYLGAVDESVLPSVYNLADVFVMPTRLVEMFGMAAIEAQACGVPVLCSNHGGLPEVIQDSSGLMFKCGDAEDLAAKLRSLMDDRELRQRLAGNSVANAERFSWENIVADLDLAYRWSPQE